MPLTSSLGVHSSCCRLTPWHWSRDGCRLVRSEVRYAVCECDKPGVYAVTTHMYNDQVSSYM